MHHTHWLALGMVLLLSSCQPMRAVAPARANVLAYPGRGTAEVGRAMDATELPLVRDLGRGVEGVGDLVEAPAVMVEGIVTAKPGKIAAGGEAVVASTGAIVTAAINLPLFLIKGRELDLAQDATLVNEALAWLENCPPEEFRTDETDTRTEVFPHGLRVKPAGRHLVYVFTDGTEILQSACESHPFRWAQVFATQEYAAQERSWGFVVPRAKRWQAMDPHRRAEVILHEFYHQYVQIRGLFRRWSTVYWPAYSVPFVMGGWHGHWAETSGNWGACAVDVGLEDIGRRPAARPSKRAGAGGE